MPDKVKAPGRVRRVSRLLIGSSRLRRPSDRVEGTLVLLLSAAFLACAAAAALLGLRYWQGQSAQAARLHPAVAVVSQAVPANDTVFAAAQATGRWRLPDGQLRSGILTTTTAPGIWGAQTGTRVQIWLTASGNQALPPDAVAMVFNAVLISATVWGGAALVLGLCYLVCRAVLDRRRLAGWESDWGLTGPRWTTRR